MLAIHSCVGLRPHLHFSAGGCLGRYREASCGSRCTAFPNAASEAAAAFNQSCKINAMFEVGETGLSDHLNSRLHLFAREAAHDHELVIAKCGRGVWGDLAWLVKRSLAETLPVLEDEMGHPDRPITFWEHRRPPGAVGCGDGGGGAGSGAAAAVCGGERGRGALRRAGVGPARGGRPRGGGVGGGVGGVGVGRC